MISARPPYNPMEEADVISQDGRNHRYECYQQDIQMALAGSDTREDQDGLSGKWQSEVLEEDSGRHTYVSPVLEDFINVFIALV